jgi:hypothetical protein
MYTPTTMIPAKHLVVIGTVRYEIIFIFELSNKDIIDQLRLTRTY